MIFCKFDLKHQGKDTQIKHRYTVIVYRIINCRFFGRGNQSRSSILAPSQCTQFTSEFPAKISVYLESVSSASRKAAECGLSGLSITAEAQYTMSDAQSYTGVYIMFVRKWCITLAVRVTEIVTQRHSTPCLMHKATHTYIHYVNEVTLHHTS